MAVMAPDAIEQTLVATDLAARALELIPIPAAHLVLTGGQFELFAMNRAYRLAGFGVVAERSAMIADLGPRIIAFLESQLIRSDFEWVFGQTIDCRYYRVTIARAFATFHDRCTISFVDQTSQIQTERSLRREMTTDSLTGLPNREGFEDLIEQGRDRSKTAVLAIDIDRFGRLNSCLGSLAGDELLITVARRIKGALRARDALARIGGDQFGILMTIDDDRDEAHALAERIQRTLTAPFRLTDYEISVECSVGIAYGADEADDVAELIRHAQFAVKRAKASGHAESYLPQDLAIARAQFSMETALRRAIENRELRLAYQPICDLATGRIVSFEALARWTTEVQVAAQKEFGESLKSLALGGTYVCRGQNHDTDAKLSEHSFANAIDVMAYGFTKRASLKVTAAPDGTPEAAFLASARTGACTFFRTVLGPGSDAAHGNHLHLDLRERNAGHRLCQ